MDLARRVYSRELKTAAMREIDSGPTISEVARSPRPQSPQSVHPGVTNETCGR